jgi:hypothetical protein
MRMKTIKRDISIKRMIPFKRMLSTETIRRML